MEAKKINWEVTYDRHRGSGMPFTSVTQKITARSKEEAISLISSLHNVPRFLIKSAKKIKVDKE